MPAGGYRVEVARGWIREAFPPITGIRIDREFIRCCACAMAFRTFDPTPVRTGHVDLTSTAQGIRLGARDLR
jgi:hypothetical protein